MRREYNIKRMFLHELLSKLMVIVVLVEKDAVSASAVDFDFDDGWVSATLPIRGPRALALF